MNTPLQIIGRAEEVDFPEQQLVAVPARIDTGAKTSSIWASNITEKDGTLEFTLFGEQSDFHTGKVVHSKAYEQRVVTSSNGASEVRYAVKMLIIMEGRKIRANFTLANRSTQVYPVLIGRNVLRGKFVVDVKLGKPIISAERANDLLKQALLESSAKDTERK